VTKYRKPVLDGVIGDEVKQYLCTTAEDLGMDILAMDVMPDHIHLLVDCKPQVCPSDAIKVLKGNTARWLFLAHPGLKASLWGGHLWNPSYFIATASERSLDQAAEYIRQQKTK
jgi:putative transposase